MGSKLLGTDVLYVACEDDEICVLLAYGIQLRPKYLLPPSTERTKMKVGDLHYLVTIEGGGKSVEMEREVIYFDLPYPNDKSIDKGHCNAATQQKTDIVTEVDAWPAR